MGCCASTPHEAVNQPIVMVDGRADQIYKTLAEELGQATSGRLALNADFALAFAAAFDLREPIAAQTLRAMFESQEVSMIEFRYFHDKWRAEGVTLEEHAARFYSAADEEPQGVKEIELVDAPVPASETSTQDGPEPEGHMPMVSYDANGPRDAHEDAGGERSLSTMLAARTTTQPKPDLAQFGLDVVSNSAKFGVDVAKTTVNIASKIPLVGGVFKLCGNALDEVSGGKRDGSASLFEREMSLQFQMMSDLLSQNMHQLQRTQMLPPIKALMAAQQMSVKAIIDAQQNGKSQSLSDEAMKRVTTLNKVVLQLANNDGSAASAALEEAGTAIDQTATVLYAKGTALTAQKKWPDAVEALRAALKQDAKLDAAWLTLGYCLGEGVKDYVGAEAAYRKAIELDPLDASAHTNLGFLMRHLHKDHDAAEAAYRKAIELDPQHAIAYFNLGNLLKGVRKDFDGAEWAFRKSIEFDPSRAGAQWNLSVLLVQRGNIDGAIEATQGYIRAGDPDGDGQHRLEELRAKRGASTNRQQRAGQQETGKETAERTASLARNVGPSNASGGAASRPAEEHGAKLMSKTSASQNVVARPAGQQKASTSRSTIVF